MLLVTMVMNGCGTITEELPTYEQTSIIGIGDMAPDFTATTIQGETITLSKLDAEATLLVLFSHTCPDCKALLDDMNGVLTDIEALSARVIAIAREGNRADIEEYMMKNGYRFDVVVDNNREIYNTYATMYVPRTYLIDNKGIVVHTTVEYKSEYIPQIVEYIEALVK